MKHPRLLILTAMKEEEASVAQVLAGHRVGEHSFGRKLPVTATEFQLGARRVFLAQSGMGTVNAALTLAALAEACEPDAVILLGVGGSITPELKVGDLVVSRKVLQHDYLSSLDFGNARMRPGDLILGPDQLKDYSPAFAADPELVDLMRTVKLDSVTGASGARIRAGTVVSGNEFVGTSRRKLELQALDPEAVLVDMEAAGVAQVAHRLGLPFVVAKTVADRLHPDGSIEADFRACLAAAARNAAEILKGILTND